MQKLKKIDRHLDKVTKMQIDRIQIFKIRKETGDITTETKGFKKNLTLKVCTQKYWKI